MDNPYSATGKAYRTGKRPGSINPYPHGSLLWEAFALGQWHGECERNDRPQAPVNYFTSAVMES